jgi:hypothetical protein
MCIKSNVPKPPVEVGDEDADYGMYPIEPIIQGYDNERNARMNAELN